VHNLTQDEIILIIQALLRWSQLERKENTEYSRAKSDRLDRLAEQIASQLKESA